MLQRTGRGASRREGRAGAKVVRARNLGFDPLEGRTLMAAALAPIANITAPAGLGFQVPLNGTGGGASQTYSVVSSNPDVKATIAQGEFLTLNITHTSSDPTGKTDPSFSGPLTFQLFSDFAPTTVAAIEQLVTQNPGFYNGKPFFRVTDLGTTGTNFIAQAGAVNVTNGGGTDTPPAPGQPGGLPATGFPFQNELAQQLAFTNPGQLAMANAGFSPSDISNGDFFTNTSQFFVTQNATRALDSGFTIFGQVVADPNDILPKIFAVAVGGSGSSTPTQPLSPVTITTATLSTTSPDGVIHVDATGATAGETSTITATAFDPATNTRTTQSFVATVGPTNPTPGPTQKPILDVFPNVNVPITTAVGQPAIFQVHGVSGGFPSDPLTYTVAGSTNAPTTQGGPVTFNPIPASEATATVDNNGIVTVTPAAGFTGGDITVLVGVRDQVDRTGNGLTDAGNYDVKQFTVDVSGSQPVNRAPIAQPVTVTASSGVANTIQLNGLSTTTGTNQNLTYAIATQPAHGTVTLVNATTGLASYTPSGTFLGADSFTYTVTDNGNTTNRTSAPGTVTINVTSGTTGAVRLIGTVLVVTPPPNPVRQQDQIAVNEVGGNIQVEVNGVLDSTQPAASSLDEIVVYGSKTGTSTFVSPTVDVPVSLDGGHGGINFINDAGSADSQIRAWFGHTAVQGGSGNNTIVGRQGRLARVVKSPGTDSVFLSGIDPYRRVPHFKVAGFHLKPQNLGAFYKFVGKKLVKTDQPIDTLLKQNQS